MGHLFLIIAMLSISNNNSYSVATADIYGAFIMIKNHFSLLCGNSFLIILLISITTSPLSAMDLSDDEIKKIEGGEVIVRNIVSSDKGTSGNAQTLEAIGIIEASVSQVYNTVTEFGSYIKFMPNVEAVDILEANQESSIITNTIGLPLGRKKSYKLNFDHSIKDQKADVSWKMIDWPEIPKEESINDTKGHWKISAYNNDPSRSLVVYHVYTDPGEIPFGFGWIVEYFTENSVPEIVINTREYIKNGSDNK